LRARGTTNKSSLEQIQSLKTDPGLMGFQAARSCGCDGVYVLDFRWITSEFSTPEILDVTAICPLDGGNCKSYPSNGIEQEGCQMIQSMISTISRMSFGQITNVQLIQMRRMVSEGISAMGSE
jgi:hypothetical protein